MPSVLFDLKKRYYLNSLFPLYRELAKDPSYDIYVRVGKDQKRFLGVFLISRRGRIEEQLRRQGYKITRRTAGFDAVVCGDALKHPERYGDVHRFHLDHGVGIKTLRIRNIQRQRDFRYHVFLEGRYWHDYVESLGWGNVADFHITGLPKLDPFFWPDFYDDEDLAERLGLRLERKTVLFAPSYKPSCIRYIKEKVVELLPEHNLIVKLHPYSWAGKYAPHSQHRFYQRLAKRTPGLYLVPRDQFDIYPYLHLADTVISDTSSVINEFLALGRHGVIYNLPFERHMHSDGMPVLSIDPAEWLKGAFPHMSAPEELGEAVELALSPTDEMSRKLREYRDYFFTGLDGEASERVKDRMDRILL